LARCRRGWADAHADRGANSHADSDTYGHANRNTYGDADTRPDCDAGGADAYGHANRDAYGHADRDTNKRAAPAARIGRRLGLRLRRPGDTPRRRQRCFGDRDRHRG
jgi:hypothetical protein